MVIQCIIVIGGKIGSKKKTFRVGKSSFLFVVSFFCLKRLCVQNFNSNIRCSFHRNRALPFIVWFVSFNNLLLSMNGNYILIQHYNQKEFVFKKGIFDKIIDARIFTWQNFTLHRSLNRQETNQRR